ncbi:MAG: hypothetical protein J5I65_09820 [Aridibacter famidurans]|nr:hypothetical protein [Aridibacter famidurans]
MSEQTQMQAEEMPPHAVLVQMGTGYWVSRIVYMAAKLDLADHLADGAKTAGDLAGQLGVQERALHRMMRSLSSLGVLKDEGDGRYGLTPLGEAMKEDAPGAAKYSLLSMAGDAMWRVWEHIDHSMKTGEPATGKALGMPIFDYLGQHPELAKQFSGAMVGIHGAEPPAVAEAYDFSQFGTITDIGGASGNMLGHILTKHSGPKGVLFDLPHVVKDSPSTLEKFGVADRVSIEEGSFFDSVPAGSDAYILSHIIHDWNEEQCLTILGNCREAMHDESKLLIVEFVLPEGDEPHIGKLLDIVMLVLPGGEERTPAEYSELLSRAGLKMTNVIPTDSPASIVEAVKG